MSGGLRIARLFGIPIYLHPTWLIVFLLITLGLSGSLAQAHPDWAPALRLLLAAATSILFFASIVAHELGHSVVAQRHRVPVRSITLFVFGGVALLERDPETPGAELKIALAGPLVSGLLAGLFALLTRATPAGSGAASMLGWLMTINGVVAVFNLLPGFPLDGGRVLRALLWARGGDPARATRVAAGVGQAIAYGFIALGAVEFLVLGSFAGGLWTAFIGWFLLSASGATMRQTVIEDSLRGLAARDVMEPDLARIDAGTSVARFAREHVMRGHRWALVEQTGQTLGIVTLTDVKRVPPEDWETTRVGQVATPLGALVTAAPDVPVRELLRTMGERNLNQIPIVDGQRFLGAVTRAGLVQALDLRRAG